MKKILFLVYLLFPCVAFAQSFSDVSSDSPYYDAIEWAAENRIVDGYSDGTFDPNRNISRAEFLELALLHSYSPWDIEHFEKTTNFFSDVDEKDWFYTYVRFVVEKKMIKGFADNTFRPNDPVQFGEAAKILYTTAHNSAMNSSDPADWASVYITQLKEKKATVYSADHMVSRAEAVQLLWELREERKEPDEMFDGYRALGGGYYEKDNALYYEFQSGKEKIENADIETFTIESSGTGVGEIIIGKDKNSIYSGGKKVEGLDPNTFTILEGFFATDGEHLYYMGDTIEKRTEVDLATFEVVHPIVWFGQGEYAYGQAMYEGFYSKDKNHVYLNFDDFSILQNADAQSFEVLIPACYEGCMGDITRDKNHYYQNGKIIEELDRNTTKIFQNGKETKDLQYRDKDGENIVFVDKDTIFIDGEIFSFSYDFESFAFIHMSATSNGYIEMIFRDKNGLSFYTNYIDQYETPSIQKEEYYKDIIRLHSQADLQTLEYVGGDASNRKSIYKDKNHFYKINYDLMNGEIFEVLPKEEVPMEYKTKDLGHGYFDKNGVIYFYDRIVPNADAESFEVIDPEKNPGFEGIFSKDKKSYYERDRELVGVDYATVAFVGGGIIKDKNAYFWMGEKLDVDYATFQLINPKDSYFGMYGKDKNRIYYFKGLAYSTITTQEQPYDVESFELITPSCFTGCRGNMVKDKNGIYQDGKIISHLNPKTAKWFSNKPFVIDEDSFLFNTEEGNFNYIIDLDSLELLQMNVEYGYMYFIIKDKNNIYYYINDFSERESNNMVFQVNKELNAKSAKSVDYNFVQDTNGLYMTNLALKEGKLFHKIDTSHIDLESFEAITTETITGPIGTGYYKDNNGYYEFKDTKLVAIQKKDIPKYLNISQ